MLEDTVRDIEGAPIYWETLQAMEGAGLEVTLGALRKADWTFERWQQYSESNTGGA